MLVMSAMLHVLGWVEFKAVVRHKRWFYGLNVCCIVLGTSLRLALTSCFDLELFDSAARPAPVSRFGQQLERNSVVQKLVGIPSWPKWPPDVEGMVLGWGYPLESHWVTTEDGFQLQLFRLPLYSEEGPKRVALLMHGLLVRCSYAVSYTHLTLPTILLV